MGKSGRPEKPSRGKVFAPKMQQVIECDVFSQRFALIGVYGFQSRSRYSLTQTHDSIEEIIGFSSFLRIFVWLLMRTRGACEGTTRTLISVHFPIGHKHTSPFAPVENLLSTHTSMRKHACLHRRKLFNLAISFLHVHTAQVHTSNQRATQWRRRLVRAHTHAHNHTHSARKSFVVLLHWILETREKKRDVKPQKRINAFATYAQTNRVL